MGMIGCKGPDMYEMYTVLKKDKILSLQEKEALKDRGEILRNY